MDFPTEFVSGMAPRDKTVTAAEAVALIRDGDTVVVEGFAAQCFAEELTLALEARFLQTGTPRDLTLAFTVAQGNRQGRGSDRLCYEGLLKRAIGGHWGMSGELGKMAVENKIEAYNLPQGVIAQLFRDTAAGKPGLLTRVGLDTFVDPRNGGGKINERTTEDRVELMTDRRSGVPVLQGIRAARRRVPSGHHRRPERQHHHGARGAFPGVPGRRHRGAQRRRPGDRAGGADRRGGIATSQGRQDPRRARRLRGRVDTRTPPADLGDAVLAGDERRTACPAVVGTAAGTVGAQGDRPPRGDGTAPQLSGQPRHRHPRRHCQRGRRGARAVATSP